MKTITKLIVIFMIPLMAAACATTPFALDEKYDLGNELEEATQIYKYRVMSWEKVDNQSLILQTGPNEYYLIILHRPAYNLVFNESIGISHTGDMVKPGYDQVYVYDPVGKDSYIIHKIYKLKDRQQARDIKERLG